jgi:hypothetical protein
MKIESKTAIAAPPLAALELRLARLLESLPPTERAALKDFASCALFCRDVAVRRLLDYCLEAGERRPRQGFHLQILGWEAFRRKNVGAEKLTSLLSDAAGLVGSFLAVRALQADAMKRHEYLAAHAAGLPDADVFRDALARWERAVEEAPVSYEKLYQRCRLLEAEWSHWATDRYKKAPRLIGEIRLAHESYVRTVQRLIDLGGSMRAHLLTDPQADHPAHPAPANRLFDLADRLAALYLRPADEAGFLAWWSDYERCFKQIGPAERESLFRALVNYCTRQMKAGHGGFVAHLFRLCNWALRRNAFTARWLRSDEDFLNVAMAFCRPDALGEMRDFIRQHAKYLPEDQREQACALALAFYYFFQKEWPEAGAQLEKVKSHEIPYKLRYHSLRIRLYYEIGKPDADFEALEKALEAYDKYFDRDEWLHDERRGVYERLAWFVRKFATLARGHSLAAGTDAYSYLCRALDNGAVKPVALEWVQGEIEKWRPEPNRPGRR